MTVPRKVVEVFASTVYEIIATTIPETAIRAPVSTVPDTALMIPKTTHTMTTIIMCSLTIFSEADLLAAAFPNIDITIPPENKFLLFVKVIHHYYSIKPLLN